MSRFDSDGVKGVIKDILCFGALIVGVIVTGIIEGL